MRAAVLMILAACGSGARAPVSRFALRSASGPVPVALHLDAASRRGYVTVGGWTSDVRHLWTAFAADVDGDGIDELILGVWSTTHRLEEPEPHRTVWVMSWDGSRLVPRFRGSALTRPLLDASAIRAAGGGPEDADEISALERDRDGGCSRARYHWTGFGFGVVAREPDRCQE